MLNLSWSFVAAKSTYKLLLGYLSMGDLYVVEQWFGSKKLTTGWLDPGWAIYWVTWLYLNCFLSDLTSAEPALGEQTLSELSTERLDSGWTITGSPDCTWTVYCLTLFWLNCWLLNLTLVELSSTWFELSWIVYWVTWLYLNCLFVDFTLAKLSTGWLICWLNLPQLNCIWVDLTLAELSTGWLDSS